MTPARRSVLPARRSVLYVPAANARALEKSAALPADAVIFDLEDSVAPEAKLAARDALKAHPLWQTSAAQWRAVRVNGLDTPWGRADMAAFADSPADALLVPKLEAVAELKTLAAAAHGKPLWAMVETPRAVVQAAALAHAGRAAQLTCFVLGSNDLARAMGFDMRAPASPLAHIAAQVLLAAKAHGLEMLDGVHNDIADEEGFAAACAAAAAMGMDGKTLIHPSQIAPANAAFAPSQEALEEARAVVAAFEAPEARGKGVLKLHGKMVERLHYDMAQRLLARHKEI